MAEGGVTEVVADVVETAGEDLIEAAQATRGFAFSGVSFGIGLAVGAGLGFIITKKRLETKYEQITKDEISQMREHYHEKTVAAEPKPDLDRVVEDLGYKAEKAKIVDEEFLAKSFEGMQKNIFGVDSTKGLSTDVWNYDRELQSRSPDKPYIIHKEEFMQGNFSGEEHEQTQLTYFIQDDVLCNERDSQVDDADDLVGLENLERFGHGSEDANVVYIRNDKLKIDFEILRDGGSYAATVHGVTDDEIQHSAMRRPSRGFVDDD